MILYELSINIDGFGGKLPNRYFYHYQDAVKTLEGTSGFYHAEDGTWDIDRMKECRSYESDNGSLTLRGVRYPKEEFDEDCIRWGEADIRKIEINEPISNNRIYILCKRYGYCSWISRDTNIDSDHDPLDKRADILLISGSKNYIKKYARAKIKNLPRVWNNREYEQEINFIDGSGRDYLSIMEFKVS